ncbi:MAG: HAMP domain-containing sensor histidine kinase, partial [Planctomycetota bacterium]
LGLVRAACPLAPIEERLHSLYVQVGWAGGLMALLAAVVSYLLYRRIDRPLREIQRGAERFAQGHFDARISLSRVGDDGGLTETLNRMAAQLHDRMATVVRQRNEHEAILSSMIEGVLAVDAEERVISMNQVAARMFGATPESVRGKLLQEVVRAPALHEFVQRALAVETPQEAEFERNDRGESRTLQVHGATLHDAAHRRLGVVVVINDVTRVRRLEGLQREFVANVSHELKTPVTSIKGFIETLQDGALENKEDAARFLEIIARHADRLETIIEDLLLLSRIDQDADSATLDRHETPLLGLIDTAAEACAVRAEDKQVILEIECPEDLRVSVGERLFTQVLVNLIDNAVKYSDAGKAVKITAAAAGSEVTVKVRDFGPGIERQHLERLGERFYRVDKARSRKLGGTGLGLAIARQIMQAHGGRLEIESTVGEGSTFSVILPVHFSES